PADWAEDPQRRKKTHVPEDVVFQEKWRIGLDLLDRCRTDLPHAWIVGDDEFGRITELRAALRLRQERYVLDVPCNTLVRDAEPGSWRPRRPPFARVDVWAARQPAARWKTITIRAGEQGPLKVRALKRRVQTKDEDGRLGPVETVVVIRSLEPQPQTW